MRCGVSTACFYPKNTLESLKVLADHGVKVIELFFNTYSELEDAYTAKLLDIIQAYQMEVTSVHPFTAVMEGFFFASDYQARLEDGIAFYSRYFQTCRLFSADKLVFHGDRGFNVPLFPVDQYADHFRRLAAVGRDYGVTLCQENVAYCRVNSPERVRELVPLLQESAAFALDFKQVRRSCGNIQDMIAAMNQDIHLIHISDGTKEQDCLPPGRGKMDFKRTLDALAQTGFTGDLIVELYSDNYSHVSQIIEGVQYINTLLES